MEMDLSQDSPFTPTSSLTLLLLPFLSLLFLLTLLRRQKEKPPIAGSVFHQLFYFSHVHDYHSRLATKYRTFRIFGPSRQIYTVDPATSSTSSEPTSPIMGRESQLREDGGSFGDGIFAVDGNKWRHQRKLASFDFSTRMLREVSGGVFKSNAAKLAQMITSMASQPYDLQDLLLKSAMDSIFKVGFGVEIDSLSGSNERGTAFARAFDDASANVSMRYVDITWKLKRFLNVGAERIHRRNLTLINDFVHDLISGKIDAMHQNQIEEDKSDILSRFLEESRRDPENMTPKYLRDIILKFLIAGKDTTAGTLTWFFYVMCKQRSIQNKVVEDIDRATEATGTVPGDMAEFARSLTDSSLDKMHYLHAALTETLRLYPAVPMDSKECFEDDTWPDGYKVRKGDVVAYLQYAMGRMRFLWGEDAEIFRPERWLDEEGRFQPESPFKFTAFQAGPRICLGKNSLTGR